MPWKETTPMDQRMEFLVDYRSGLFTVSGLAQRHGVSRKTAYKWIGRLREEGYEGAVRERTSRPHESPERTAEEVERKVVECRRRHVKWGPKKLLEVLRRGEPELALPAASTVGAILRRNGLVKRRVRREVAGHPGRPVTVAEAPNVLWAADYKGQFRTGDGEYCYPLTVTDQYSRYILGCRGLLSTATEGAKKGFERAFREYGLPERIRTDNGAPFASNGVARLTRLSVWFIRLGIWPELTQPAHPEQNGTHERMHRTLKDETTRPPGANLRAQQKRFDAFVQEFNHDRPHEGIGMKRPADLYRPSPRPFPHKLAEVEYPGHYEVRTVSKNGGVRWKKGWLNISHPLIDERIGLEEVDDGVWNVTFSFLLLGRFEEREKRLYGAFYTHRKRTP